MNAINDHLICKAILLSCLEMNIMLKTTISLPNHMMHTMILFSQQLMD